MKCRDFGKRMSEYMDGQLDDAERADFDAHLRDCPACASELASARKLEDEARRATAAAPAPGLESRVLGLLDSGAGIPDRPAHPAPRSFRFPTGLAAGILVGVALGFVIHASIPRPEAPGADPGGRAPTPAVETTDLEPMFISKDLTEAKQDLDDFVNASELLASDINTLPLGDDPSYSWVTLRRILNAMDYEKKLGRARRARPVLEHFEPECTPLLDSYLEEQADIRNLISDSSISPRVVKDVQAKALTTMDNVYNIRRRFGLRERQNPLHIRVADIGNVSLQLTIGGEGECIAQASKFELEKDFSVALALCQNLRKKYPRSRLKPLAFTRELRIWSKAGHDDRMVRMFEKMPQVFRPGEIGQGFLVSVTPLLKNLGDCDPKKKNLILGKIVGRFSQRWTPFSVIQSVRLDGTAVPVEGEDQEKTAFTLFALLPKAGWNSAMHVNYVSEDPGRKTVRARFTKGEALGENLRRLLEKLLREVSPPLDLDALETIEFEGK